MAIFNRINKHSKVVGIVIGLGLALFIIGGEFFGPNSFFNKGRNDVGEINGQNISYDEYRFETEKTENDYSMRSGRAVTEVERPRVQEMAWNELVFKYAYQEQFDKLGIKVTDEELVEMVQGNNIHPTIKQLFTNPQTQQFDKNFVKDFLASIDKREARDQALWTSVEKSLPADRLKTKYFNLFKKSDYVTSQEAKREYNNQNAKAEIKFLYVPFYSIADSTIKVTDEELKDYIGKNKDKYKVEEGRTIDYVSFSIGASANDSLSFKKELEALKTDFQTNENDSLFVINNSDNPTSPTYKNIGELPEELKSDANNLTKGSVYGPFNQNGKYVLYKVIGLKNDSIYSARASHILFKAKSETPADKSDAMKQANDVLKQIKAGASFEQMAKTYGTDGTASKGGDLGWFTEGQMVKKFNSAIFSASKPGLLPAPIETEFGYHIIKVTETKTNKKYQVASVEREIGPSDETRDLAFKKADAFVANTNDTAEFNKNVKNDPSLQKNTVKNLKKNDRNVNALANAREIVRWAYNDAEFGKVSPVFTLENQYVVAVLTGKRDEGTAEVDDVRDEVTMKVKAEKKAEQILAKIKDGKGDLSKLATQFGPSAVVNTAPDITFASYSIPGLGYEPEAIGKAFGLKKGTRSAPINGENGVVIVELMNSTPSADIADYAVYKTQVTQQRSGREDYTVDEAIKKFSNIEDRRYKYF